MHNVILLAGRGHFIITQMGNWKFLSIANMAFSWGQQESCRNVDSEHVRCRYIVAKVAGFKEPQRRAISIEVGMQNSSLGVVLATTHFASPLTAVPAAISALLMNIMGSGLAVLWRNSTDGGSRTSDGQATGAPLLQDPQDHQDIASIQSNADIPGSSSDSWRSCFAPRCDATYVSHLHRPPLEGFTCKIHYFGHFLTQTLYPYLYPKIILSFSETLPVLFLTDSIIIDVRLDLCVDSEQWRWCLKQDMDGLVWLNLSISWLVYQLVVIVLHGSWIACCKDLCIKESTYTSKINFRIFVGSTGILPYSFKKSLW